LEIKQWMRTVEIFFPKLLLEPASIIAL